MAWTDIANADVAVGSPLDTALMTALRDNPIATAEGAPGAPRVAPLAMKGGRVIGVATASSNNWVGFSDLEDISEVELQCYGSYIVQVRLSDDNGTTWGAPQDFFGFTNQSNISRIFFNLDTGEFSAIRGTGETAVNTGTLTLPSGTVDAFQVRKSAGSDTFGVMAMISGGRG